MTHRGLRRRLGSIRRTSPPAQDGLLRGLWHAQQPGFREAVVADARFTARYRGERHEFRSRADTVVQLLRLAWVTDSFGAQLCYRAKVACRVRGIPVAPRVLHHLAIRQAQVNIGDQVVVRPGSTCPTARW